MKKTVTQKQFRIILLIYAVFYIAVITIGAKLDFLSNQSTQEISEEIPLKIVLVGMLMGFLFLFHLILKVISWIGLFIFKRFARYLFAISDLIVYAVIPITFALLSKYMGIENTLNSKLPIGWSEAQIFSYLVVILSATIIVCSFTRVGSSLFIKKRNSN